MSSVVSVVANTSLTVLKHIYLVPGVVLQLTHPTDVDSSVMVEVEAVTPVSATEARLDILPGYTFGTDFVGADVSVAQNFLRAEVLYGSTSDPLHFGASYTIDGVTYQNVQVTGARWVENQWKGYKAFLGGDFDGGGAVDIVSNMPDFLVIATGGGQSLTDDLVVAIAKDYSGGPAFADRVPVWKLTSLGRGLTTTLEPSLDLERKGTPWYGHNHLIGDEYASPINGGGWLPYDVGLKITTPNLVTLFAKTVSLSNDGLTIGLAVVTAMTTNALAGSWINPNRNQTQLFKIVSNTANTVTVDAPADAVFSASEVAYVLGPRVAVVYERVLAQLKKYVNPDVRIHLLFD